MDLSNLIPEQSVAVAACLRPILDYLAKLTRRMDEIRWRPNDPAYAVAWKAHKALDELTAAVTDPHRPLNSPPAPLGAGRHRLAGGRVTRRGVGPNDRPNPRD